MRSRGAEAYFWEMTVLKGLPGLGFRVLGFGFRR